MQRDRRRPGPRAVRARQAVQHVAAAGADQPVVERVAGQRRAGRPRGDEHLHIRRQGMARQRGLDGVDALVRALDDDIAGIVDDVIVVAAAADQAVRAAAAIERIRPGAAIQRIGPGQAEQASMPPRPARSPPGGQRGASPRRCVEHPARQPPSRREAVGLPAPPGRTSTRTHVPLAAPGVCRRRWRRLSSSNCRRPASPQVPSAMPKRALPAVTWALTPPGPGSACSRHIDAMVTAVASRTAADEPRARWCRGTAAREVRWFRRTSPSPRRSGPPSAHILVCRDFGGHVFALDSILALGRSAGRFTTTLPEMLMLERHRPRSRRHSGRSPCWELAPARYVCRGCPRRPPWAGRC